MRKEVLVAEQTVECVRTRERKGPQSTYKGNVSRSHGIKEFPRTATRLCQRSGTNGIGWNLELGEGNYTAHNCIRVGYSFAYFERRGSFSCAFLGSLYIFWLQIPLPVIGTTCVFSTQLVFSLLVMPLRIRRFSFSCHPAYQSFPL